jgi:hypothetical protein
MFNSKGLTLDLLFNNESAILILEIFSSRYQIKISYKFELTGLINFNSFKKNLTFYFKKCKNFEF